MDIHTIISLNVVADTSLRVSSPPLTFIDLINKHYPLPLQPLHCTFSVLFIFYQLSSIEPVSLTSISESENVSSFTASWSYASSCAAPLLAWPPEWSASRASPISSFRDSETSSPLKLHAEYGQGPFAVFLQLLVSCLQSLYS